MSTSVGRIDGHRFGSQSTSSETHLAGRILWLPWPKKRTIGLGQDGAVPRRLYNHPVVLLSPEPIRGKVMVLSLTSFQDRDILDAFPSHPEARGAYVPVYPSNRHPDTGLRLYLIAGLTLRRNSYVNTQKPLSIALEHLGPYDRDNSKLHYALRSDSYQQLVKYTSVKNPAGLFLLSTQKAPFRPNGRLLAESEATRSSFKGSHQQPTHNISRVAAGTEGDNSSYPTHESQPFPFEDYAASALIWSVDTTLHVAYMLFRLIFKAVVAGIYITALCVVWSYRTELMEILEPATRWVEVHVFQRIDTVIEVVIDAVAEAGSASATGE